MRGVLTHLFVLVLIEAWWIKDGKVGRSSANQPSNPLSSFLGNIKMGCLLFFGWPWRKTTRHNTKKSNPICLNPIAHQLKMVAFLGEY